MTESDIIDAKGLRNQGCYDALGSSKLYNGHCKFILVHLQNTDIKDWKEKG